MLPIETLSPYTDIEKLNIGDKITTLNGHLICESIFLKEGMQLVMEMVPQNLKTYLRRKNILSFQNMLIQNSWHITKMLLSLEISV